MSEEENEKAGVWTSTDCTEKAVTDGRKDLLEFMCEKLKFRSMIVFGEEETDNTADSIITAAAGRFSANCVKMYADILLKSPAIVQILSALLLQIIDLNNRSDADDIK